MKNVKRYVKSEITRKTVLPSGRGFTPELVNEATETVMTTIDKNQELGNIHQLDEKTVDYIIFRVIDTYF